MRLPISYYTTVIDNNEELLEVKLTIYYFGCDGTMYRSNGDPGDPPESPEYDLEIVNNTNKETIAWFEINQYDLADEVFDEFIDANSDY